MDIKINKSTPLKTLLPDNNSTAISTLNKTGKTTSQSSVDEIVKDLISGSISSDVAVNRLIANTMDTSIVQNAPQSLKLEVEQMLKVMIETDPHLKSLVKNLE